MTLADLVSPVEQLRRESPQGLARLCHLADVGPDALLLALRGRAALSKDTETRLRTLLSQFQTPKPKDNPMLNGTDTTPVQPPRRLTDAEVAQVKLLGNVSSIERALSLPKSRVNNALRPMPDRLKLPADLIAKLLSLTVFEVAKHAKKSGPGVGNPKTNKVPPAAPKKTFAPKRGAARGSTQRAPKAPAPVVSPPVSSAGLSIEHLRVIYRYLPDEVLGQVTRAILAKGEP